VKVVMLLGRSTGGIGTHVAQLSADLRERGVDVIVVTHPLTAEHFDLGPHRLCWPGSAGVVHVLADLMALRRLAATADIVHAHGNQAGLLGALAICSGHGMPGVRPRPTRQGPKLIVSQHNAVLEGSGRQVLKKMSQCWVARHADLVTGASSDLVNEARACGASRAELAEVPSPRVPQLLAQQPADAAARAGIRQSLLGSLGLDLGAPAAPVVLTICRIATQKNLLVLVQAAAQLRQACIWVVLGEGDPLLLAQLRAQVSALGAPVHFVGSSREVDTWLRGAEVFVLPSQWEARALVVQEAMAAGTPVVVADVGGLHGLVLQAGLLVPPGDPVAIAKATDSILADPGMREELAAHGREVAAALPDGPDTASRWLAWYSQTLPMT
jgi:glycosyltransferase involved in cell wall biosynthesis